MKIIERMPREGPADSAGRPFSGRRLATVAVVLILASLVAGYYTVGPISRAFFGTAFGLTLWTVMIAGAFEADRRRRWRELRGQ